MTRGMWNRSVIAVGMLIALVAAGCGSDSSSSGGSSTTGTSSKTAASTKTVNVAMFGFSSANAYTQYAKKGAEAAAKADNIKLTFFDGKFDPATQFNQVQDATASGKFQGYFVLANDGNSMLPAIKQAIAKGIKVTNGQYPLGPDFKTLAPQVDGLTSTIGYTVPAEAEGSAALMADACVAKVGAGKPCTVAVMSGNRKMPFDAFKLKFVQSYMKSKHPEIKVITAPDGAYTRDGGQKSATDLLQSQPNTDVIGAIGSDAMAIGAEQAIKSAGKTPGKDIMLIGLGASKSGVAGIKSGAWFGDVVTQPYTIGKLGVSMAADAARGKPVKQTVDMYGYAPVGATVTKKSLDANPSFTGEWEG